MIRVFSPSDKTFETNGDAVINPTRAIVHKVDNGDYFLEFEASSDYSEYLKPSNIIVAPTPQGYQPFRIEAAVEKTRTKIRFNAWHIYYDSENYLIADSYVVNKTCKGALEHLNNATDNPSPFTVDSDITTINSYRCVRTPLSGAVSTVLERWGGHLVRDGFKIAVKRSIGNDNGVTIQYRKNLKDISVAEDWSTVCTKLLPVGADGYTIPGLYLYAETQYPIPFTKTVSFDQSNIDRDSYPTEEAYMEALRQDLIAKGTEYLKVAQYPTINYTLSANMETITDVGDIVEVYDERLGVNITAAVISFEYDCILGKYTQVEFGSTAPALSNLLSSVSSEVSSSLSAYTADLAAYLQGAVEVAVAEIWEALGASYVIYNGDEILVVDTLPAQEATNLMRIDREGISISNNGIFGTFKKILKLNGELDLSSLTVSGIHFDSVSGGEMKLGGLDNGKGIGKVLSSSGSTLAQMDKDGISISKDEAFTIEGESILSKVLFSSLDTFQVERYTVSGYITSLSSDLVFTLPLGKSLERINEVEVNDLYLNVRLPDGTALFGSIIQGGYDVLSDANLTVTEEMGENFITFTVTSSTPWSVTDEMPVTVTIESLDLLLT